MIIIFLELVEEKYSISYEEKKSEQRKKITSYRAGIEPTLYHTLSYTVYHGCTIMQRISANKMQII